MFRHAHGLDSFKQHELEIDYMARALLMPLDTIATLLRERDYEHMSVEEKKKFVWYVSDRFQVPIQQAVLRIKEVRLLEGKSEG